MENLNIVDIFCIALLAISVLYGMYRGFISGILSLAALIGSVFGAFTFSGQIAQMLKGNQTLVATLMYYTDAASRIGSLDLSLLTVSQVTKDTLTTILQKANLPEVFQQAFVGNFQSAAADTRVSTVLSQTIVNASISILSFLVCFFVLYLAALLIVHLIAYVFEFPILRHLDSLAGGAFGFIRGYVMLMILFIVVPIILAVAPVQQITDLLEASQLRPLFDSRLIFQILGLNG